MACALTGPLREESLAINKSLFTLRQVVLALSTNSTQNQQGAARPKTPSKAFANSLPGSGAGGGPAGTVAAGVWWNAGSECKV